MNADQVAAAEAREALRLALISLADRDGKTPCAHDDRFTAEALEVLQSAAQECSRCPIQAECGEAGAGETWGVWAGRVVGGRQKTGRKGKTA